MSDIYSYIDRPSETKLIELKLRDHDREVLQTVKINLSTASKYKKTDYNALLGTHQWLEQGDIDRIEDGDVRLFIYSVDESWGFKYQAIVHNGGELTRGEDKFIPFESTEWEMNFFDGKR